MWFHFFLSAQMFAKILSVAAAVSAVDALELQHGHRQRIRIEWENAKINGRKIGQTLQNLKNKNLSKLGGCNLGQVSFVHYFFLQQVFESS